MKNIISLINKKILVISVLSAAIILLVGGATLDGSSVNFGPEQNRLSHISSDEFEGLTEEQLGQINDLRDSARPFVGQYIRQEEIIKGTINANAPKLDIATVRSIVQENDAFFDILTEMKTLQTYPDVARGSGLTIIEYWFDDVGIEKIEVVIEEERIVYLVSGTSDEVLFGGCNIWQIKISPKSHIGEIKDGVKYQTAKDFENIKSGAFASLMFSYKINSILQYFA